MSAPNGYLLPCDACGRIFDEDDGWGIARPNTEETELDACSTDCLVMLAVGEVRLESEATGARAGKTRANKRCRWWSW